MLMLGPRDAKNVENSANSLAAIVRLLQTQNMNQLAIHERLMEISGKLSRIAKTLEGEQSMGFNPFKKIVEAAAKAAAEIESKVDEKLMQEEAEPTLRKHSGEPQGKPKTNG